MSATKKTISQVDEQEEVIASSPSDDRQWFIKQQQENHNRLVKMHSDLSEPFPAEVERQLKKGGTYLTYIPVSEVINRLNTVFGFDNWSYQIIRCERDALDPDFIVAHVRLDVFPNSDRYASVSKDGFGGQKIKRTKSGEIVDLGDEFKGAVSDALKKAAQSLGIGLYLARTEEALEALEAPPAPVVDPKIAELWDNFVSFSKALTVEQKQELNKFWDTYGKGKPKPTKATASEDDLTALIEECIRLSFAKE